jgi:dienelactone hydrolase
MPARQAFPAAFKPWELLKMGLLRHRRIIIGGPLFLASGCVAAAAAAIVRHIHLVAYGIGCPVGAAYGVAAGWLGLAVLLGAAAIWLLRRPANRGWIIFPACALIVFFGGLSALGVYCLEVKYEKGESNLGRLANFYHDLPSWQARAATLRGGILRGAGLEPLPARTPLNPVRHSLREHGGYCVENVRFESIPGFFVCGNLYRPAAGDDGAKKPVVLIPHGHFKLGRFEESNQQLGATIARMGAIAFTYDMVGRGEIHPVSHNDPNSLTLQVWDSMRVLDFLLGLPDADPARVGMTGASGGGTQTFLCTAVDDRVTVSAPVVMVSSWVYGGCACESGLPIHRGPGYATNNAEIAALAAPRPQLVVSDGNDWTCTVPVLELPYLRRVYGLFGAEAAVQNVHLAQEKHDYGPSKRDAVYRFFAKHLGLPIERVMAPDGSIDESPNTIEPMAAMRAFDAAHPLPVDALQGWDAVMAGLRRLQQR